MMIVAVAILITRVMYRVDPLNRCCQSCNGVEAKWAPNETMTCLGSNIILSRCTARDILHGDKGQHAARRP
jgi:hypothetical protein